MSMNIHTIFRTLHVMDIENLLGDARPSDARVHAAWVHYQELFDVSNPNQLVVACNHGAACVVGCCFGASARLLVRSGRDGADEALLDVLTYEAIDSRFRQVVIASGDGIFVESVKELIEAGVHVTVVARRNSLSNRLREVASRVIYFEPTLSCEYEMKVAA